MRELLSTPSLFDDPVAGLPAPAPSPTAQEEKRSGKIAKEFVRWCCSFGLEFRNAPDVINLRTWSQKAKLRIKKDDEAEVLVEARRIYLKKIEQMMKKSDSLGK